jgi:hypothetical protein
MTSCPLFGQCLPGWRTTSSEREAPRGVATASTSACISLALRARWCVHASGDRVGRSLWTQPQRCLGRLHGLLNYGQDLSDQGVQVDMVTQLGPERLEDPAAAACCRNLGQRRSAKVRAGDRLIAEERLDGRAFVVRDLGAGEQAPAQVGDGDIVKLIVWP